MQKLIAGFFVPSGNEPGISFPGSDPLQMAPATLAGNGFDYQPKPPCGKVSRALCLYFSVFPFSKFSDLKPGALTTT